MRMVDPGPIYPSNRSFAACGRSSEVLGDTSPSQQIRGQRHNGRGVGSWIADRNPNHPLSVFLHVGKFTQPQNAFPPRFGTRRVILMPQLAQVGTQYSPSVAT